MNSKEHVCSETTELPHATIFHNCINLNDLHDSLDVTRTTSVICCSFKTATTESAKTSGSARPTKTKSEIESHSQSMHTVSCVKLKRTNVIEMHYSTFGKVGEEIGKLWIN